MPATITRLVSATPMRQERKNGYALEWNDSPNSPLWLPKDDFDTLRANLGQDYDDVFVKALEAGQTVTEESEE